MTDENTGPTFEDNATPQSEVTTVLPRTCIDTPGRVIAISDAVLLDGLNIVAEERAQGVQMHGGILEQFMNRKEGGQVVNIADDNRYAGIAHANGPQGQAFPAVTIGRGNHLSHLMPDDGALVAELILEGEDSVFMNVGGFTPQGVADFNRDFSEVFSQMDDRTMPMVFGFAMLDQHMPHRRMGKESLTVRNGHFMRGRLRRANAGVVNLMRSLGEIPGEFDKNIANLLVMLQSNPDYREALIARLPTEYAALAKKAERVPDCGLALAGIRHGTYFNHSDLDRDGPYVRIVNPLRSLLGVKPDPQAPVNDATRSFMDRLAIARRKREDLLNAAKATSQLQASIAKLRKAEADRQAAAILRNGAVEGDAAWSAAVAAIMTMAHTEILSEAAAAAPAAKRTARPRGIGSRPTAAKQTRLARRNNGIVELPGLLHEIRANGLKDGNNVRAATFAIMESEGTLTSNTTVADVIARAMKDDARQAKMIGWRICERVQIKHIGEAAVACLNIIREGGVRGERFLDAVGRMRNASVDPVIVETTRRLHEAGRGSTEYGTLGSILMNGWASVMAADASVTPAVAANDDRALPRAA